MYDYTLSDSFARLLGMLRSGGKLGHTEVSNECMNYKCDKCTKEDCDCRCHER